MRRFAISMVLAPAAIIVGCATRAEKPVGTLASLRDVRPDVQDVKVEGGLDQALVHYRRFLEETPETAMRPEAMRRLADLQIEKQFGIRIGDARPREMAAPDPSSALSLARAGTSTTAAAAGSVRESDQDFESRTTASGGILTGSGADAFPAGPADAAPEGPLEAIALYDQLLAEYPNYEHRDKVLTLSRHPKKYSFAKFARALGIGRRGEPA